MTASEGSRVAECVAESVTQKCFACAQRRGWSGWEAVTHRCVAGIDWTRGMSVGVSRPHTEFRAAVWLNGKSQRIAFVGSDTRQQC